ncbi:protein induced by osmotic stress [Scheffersomyces amazonensis]|uniref:protein induced by osmotic stress n=1 Tax=Scheffersomyces amazonensis TaxID=1078765 RepID=UPI00315D1D5B
MTVGNQTSVFVSGATGYIAQHIIAQLLSKGYKVVGSVRSEGKGDGLAETFKNSNFSYEVVPILEKEGAFDEALKKHPEVTVFLHTASPFTYTVEDNERDILIPAIQGTKSVLESIKKYAPQITRLVYTSSSVATGTVAEITTPGFSGGEHTWNSTSYEDAKKDSVSAYFGSKTFAEKAAWDFVENEKPNFTLTSINPVYVFGPQNTPPKTKELNLSAAMVGDFLKLGPNDDVPQMQTAYIDVRDVAKAHIIAFEKDEAQGKRFVLADCFFDGQLILDFINNNFPELKGKLPVGKPGEYTAYGPTTLNDSNARSILNIEYISLEKSVVDTIKQIVHLKE